MTAPANLRGWGQGWPVNRSSDMAAVRAARSGTEFTVHRDIAPIVKYLVDEVERRGYLLHYPGQVHDDWSYSNRPIRGRRVASNHSWGLAIDLDATQFPLGSSKRLPTWVVELFRAHGFDYGGDWSGRKDPMHFEFNGWPSDARRIAAQLLHTPAAPPAGQPAPIPPPRKKKPMFIMKGDARQEIYITDLIAKRHLKRQKDVDGARLALQSAGFKPDTFTVEQAFLDAIPVQR